MNAKDFCKAVADMRRFQKAYEKEPDELSLKMKEMFELQIDVELERVNKILKSKGEEEL